MYVYAVRGTRFMWYAFNSMHNSSHHGIFVENANIRSMLMLMYPGAPLCEAPGDHTIIGLAILIMYHTVPTRYQGIAVYVCRYSGCCTRYACG